MCSLHARVAKKFNGIFDAARGEMQFEVTDDSMYRFKVARQHAVDEFMGMKGCAISERYLKALQMPVPPSRNITLVHNHIELLIKTLR